MDMTLSNPEVLGRRDWRTAFVALRRLLADADDTPQVFRIMRALNAGSARRGYERLAATLGGGRIAYERVELAERLSDRAWLESFAEGTVGATYRAFLDSTGYTAEGLAEVSRADDSFRDAPHPYAWFGRRMRDTHDIWHVLTGYRANDALGELCLVAFTYAQSGGIGWALIAAGGAFKGLRMGEPKVVKAIWEGYRRGKAAKWLPGEDYAALLAEPLETARARLGIGAAIAYPL